jgi:hypothetical protein
MRTFISPFLLAALILGGCASVPAWLQTPPEQARRQEALRDIAAYTGWVRRSSPSETREHLLALTADRDRARELHTAITGARTVEAEALQARHGWALLVITTPKIDGDGTVWLAALSPVGTVENALVIDTVTSHGTSQLVPEFPPPLPSQRALLAAGVVPVYRQFNHISMSTTVMFYDFDDLRRGSWNRPLKEINLFERSPSGAETSYEREAEKWAQAELKRRSQ